jgi:hypothetical protein
MCTIYSTVKESRGIFVLSFWHSARISKVLSTIPEPLKYRREPTVSLHGKKINVFTLRIFSILRSGQQRSGLIFGFALPNHVPS